MFFSPGIGEIIGGSQERKKIDVWKLKMQECT